MCPDCEITHSENQCWDSLPEVLLVRHQTMFKGGNPAWGLWNRITNALAAYCWVDEPPAPTVAKSWQQSGMLNWTEGGGEYIIDVLS